jgi:hypothetical protein
MIYSLGDDLADMVEYKATEPDPLIRLPPSFRKVLKELHGPTGDIRVWREIKLDLGNDQGTNYVRAFHDFDSYGKFFDWAQISLDQGVDGYTPAKVLLLYQTNTDEDCALVWMAKHATANKLQQETNISARWKMDLVASTGLPNIVSIPTNKIKKCILVHVHWQCINKNTLPTTERLQGSDTSMFVVDELYDRYSWCLNFVDPD